ncbi:hypothetical protein [Streptomyces chartreusis]
MSTKRGLAPTARMAWTVAQNVRDGTATSSLGPTPRGEQGGVEGCGAGSHSDGVLATKELGDRAVVIP